MGGALGGSLADALLEHVADVANLAGELGDPGHRDRDQAEGEEEIFMPHGVLSWATRAAVGKGTRLGSELVPAVEPSAA